MDNIDYKKIKAWPFQEAIKLKNKVSKIANKKIVTLETGYGPSGDPHIGTFAEVLRTNMVLNCLKEISDYSTFDANPVSTLHSTITPLKVASPLDGKCLIASFFKNLFNELSLSIPITEL